MIAAEQFNKEALDVIFAEALKMEKASGSVVHLIQVFMERATSTLTAETTLPCGRPCMPHGQVAHARLHGREPWEPTI